MDPVGSKNRAAQKHAATPQAESLHSGGFDSSRFLFTRGVFSLNELDSQKKYSPVDAWYM